MKNLLLILVLLSTYINAQTYKELTAKASNLVEKDSTKYKKALNLYEKAFQKYPTKIDAYELFKASVIASHLNQNNKAFNFLSKLIKIEKDSDGYPGWDYISEENTQKELRKLYSDKRWKTVIKETSKLKQLFLSTLNSKQKDFFKTSITHFSIENSKELYNTIKNYQPYLFKKSQNYSIEFKINDSLKTSYYVHLPKKYNPKKRYPLLFFLHGGVRFSNFQDYQLENNLKGWNRFYTKYADKNDVILVFPSASKKYNWMTPDDGFFMIPNILKQIKKCINIDDNKVFISGHSNGATGSFSYLMKQPTGFAGMYGFNTHPMVYTGGTFIENIKNRSFINFSTDKDYYYPPNANDTLSKVMKNINADYKDYRYNGFPHWFPEFDESESAYKILFSDLKNKLRNPFPKEINWEFDDNNYGNVDWINHIKLDTITKKRDWHKSINFKIKKWYGYNKKDSLVARKVNKNAFNFPRKSGKIIANYNNNVFNIKTSQIKSFEIFISPEMVNLNNKIKVYVNGKLYFKKKLNYNKPFILSEYEKKYDRKQIWVNFIKINL